MDKGHRTILFGLFFLLSACGGGGDGGTTSSPPIPIAITTNNADKVTAEASGATSVGLTLGDAGGSIVSFEHSPNLRRRIRLDSLGLQLMNRLGGLLLSQPSRIVGAQVTINDNCTLSGSFSGTLNDVDNNSMLTTGDTLNASFSDCSFDAGITLRGTIAFTNVTVNGDPTAPGTAWDVALTVTLSDFQVIEATGTDKIDGDLTLTMKTSDGTTFTNTLKVTSLRGVIDGESGTISNFSADYTEDTNSLAYTLKTSGTVSASGIGGSVSFSTPVTLTGTDLTLAEPEGGQLRIFGANNSQLTVTALGGGGVRIEVDADGDGQTDANGTHDTTWTALEAL